MKKAIFCALLPLLVQGFQAAWAEEGSAVRKRAADEEEAAPQLATVVVQGRRETPALQMQVETRSARQPLQSADAARFLTRMPGFAALRKGGGNSEAVLRGMSGSRLGILADGVELYGSCWQRMDSPLSYIYPDAYEQVTLIKGPQSVSHGAGMSAGVVEFKRRRPVFEQPGIRFDGAALAGSFGRNDQMAEVLAGHAQWYGRVGATRSESQSYKEGAGLRVHSAWRRWSGDAALGWTPDARTLLELAGGASDGQADYADRHSDATRLHRAWWKLKLEKQAVSPWVKRIDAFIHHSHADHVMDNYSMRTIHPSWEGILMVMNPQNKLDQGRLSVDLEPAKNVIWTLGLDRQRVRTFNRMAMFYPSLVGIPGLPPDVVERNTTDYRRIELQKYHDVTKTGAFTELLWPLDAANTQRLAGGARLDRVEMEMPSVKAASRRTLRSGFVRYERDVPQWGSFYAGLGHSQRFPDYWEYMWINERVGGASYASLRPERLTQLDAGFAMQRGRWSAQVSGFYGRSRDYLLFHWRPAIFVENIDARQFGLEAQAHAQITPAWSARASLAWVRGFNLTRHTSLPQRPPLTATLEARYAQGGLSAGVKLLAAMRQKHIDYGTGGVDGFDQGPTPGHATVSLDASWQIQRGLTFSAGIDNLFNRQYSEHLSAGAAPGTPRSLVEPLSRLNEPGRAFWLRVSYRY